MVCDTRTAYSSRIANTKTDMCVQEDRCQMRNSVSRENAIAKKDFESQSDHY